MATWVGYPRSYTPGRARPIQYVVIHSTEGSEGPTSAEAGAAYDKRRTDGTSTHLFVDSDTALREVPDADRAHAARFHGNEIGVQVELCGRASQTAAQWHDEYSLPMLRLAAVEVAAICREHDIPVRRLTTDEVRAAYYGQVKPKGICGHVHVTAAYPEDGGSHTDPGPNFPWDEFLDMVRAEMEDDVDAAGLYAILSEDSQAGRNLRNYIKTLCWQYPGAETSPAARSFASVNAKLDKVLATPVVAGPVDAAALKAVLLDPEVAAAYAKAVNDDAAARLAD